MGAKTALLVYTDGEPVELLRGAARRRVILHAVHSVIDWFAFAVWENGALVRSLSVAPRGALEDIGTPLDFERPYWAGDHPVGGSPVHPPYPLPFHPLDLGAEAAMRSLFGFILEGRILDTDIDPEAVRLVGYQVTASDPVTEAEVREFMRTHTRRQYRFGPTAP